MYTAEQILHMVYVGDLFTDNESAIKREYKQLAKYWHPDIHPEPALASTVMSKINSLYELALQSLKEGTWAESNAIQFRTVDRKLIKLKFLTAKSFELGKVYLGRRSVVYVVEKQYKEFFDNYVDRVSNLNYANERMRSEFEKYLPTIEDRFETADSYGVIVRKTEDVLSLRDILTAYNGKLPDRHLAWVLSSLYNLACFLHYNGLSHNGITVDNYFISPQCHSGVLLGGWWYTVPYGDALIGASQDVFEVMTPKTKTTKQGTYITDLDSIRQLGRELLGDRLGLSSHRDSGAPEALHDWLLGASVNKPFDEYRAWGTTLDRSYGKRTFVEMKITADDLYSK